MKQTDQPKMYVKPKREDHTNEVPPPGFDPDQWVLYSRQLRQYHRNKHRGICVLCKTAPRDDVVSRTMCRPCLAKTRENARERFGAGARYKSARSYSQAMAEAKAGDPPPIKAT